jgi:TonB family protein
MAKLKQIVFCAALLAGFANAAEPERKAIRHDEPEYPEIAAKMNIHGSVKLRIWIAPDGSVRRLEYIGGHPLLAESALKAVKAWKYEKALDETTAVVDLKF